MDRITSHEFNYVNEVLNSAFRSSSGSSFTSRLENEFAHRFGIDFAIAFINGTATMHASLEALGIGIGDEVIVPPLTMAATAFAVLQCNATPVFADIDPNTFQIDPLSIESRVTNKTKAIITVALYGLSPDYDPIKRICQKYNLKLIEDNAECFLGTYNDNLVGTFGDCASFSFQSSKHLTSGEGGIIITNDQELANQIRKVNSLGYSGVGASKAKIRKQDIQLPEYSRHTSLGWNYRMPELCSAVALAQVQRIDELVTNRIRVAQIFAEEINQCVSWFQPQYVPSNCMHSYWTTVYKNINPNISWRNVRDKFISLGGDGIYGAWKLTYLEPCFQNLSLLGRENFISPENKAMYKKGSCPVAEAIQPQLFQLKTNYWDLKVAHQQAKLLKSTLKSLD